MVVIELAVFILACSGLTQILCYGKIFDKIRPTRGFFGELFSCSLCVGFHCGYLVAFLTNFSGLIQWKLEMVDYLLLACLSSSTSYILDKMIGDEGIRINETE
jgi:hypothetical protein